MAAPQLLELSDLCNLPVTTKKILLYISTIESLPLRAWLIPPTCLLGKILQQIANGTEFGVKESHMIPFNDLLHTNKEALFVYLQTACVEIPVRIDPVIFFFFFFCNPLSF